MTLIAAVSFARTPLEEISAKVEEIKALGWREREDGRGDPWAASFAKDVPEDEARNTEAELDRVSVEPVVAHHRAKKALLASKSD